MNEAPNSARTPHDGAADRPDIPFGKIACVFVFLGPIIGTIGFLLALALQGANDFENPRFLTVAMIGGYLLAFAFSAPAGLIFGFVAIPLGLTSIWSALMSAVLGSVFGMIPVSGMRIMSPADIYSREFILVLLFSSAVCWWLCWLWKLLPDRDGFGVEVFRRSADAPDPL